MDFYSLVAGGFGQRPRPAEMTAKEEQRYYARVSLPRLPSGLVGSLATLAGIVLVLLVGGHVW